MKALSDLGRPHFFVCVCVLRVVCVGVRVCVGACVSACVCVCDVCGVCV